MNHYYWSRRQTKASLNMFNKEAIRHGKRQIRSLLLRDWDPIGVRDFPQAQDEYDAYVGHVHYMLRTGATDDEIVAYLQDIETRHMGLGLRAPAAYRSLVSAMRDLKLDQ